MSGSAVEPFTLTTKPNPLRRALRNSAADGALYSIMVGCGETYLPAFVLALSFGDVSAGLIATIPQLTGAILQLASPAAVHWLGSHRRWVVFCAALQGLSFFPLILGAIFGRIPLAVLFIVATLYWAGSLGAGPAWNTWMARLVPLSIRPRYFARRAAVLHISVLAGVMLGGWSLQWGSAAGRALTVFAAIFTLAMICRLGSARLLATIHERPLRPQDHRKLDLTEVRRHFTSGDGRLLIFILTTQVAVQIAQPFFNPFMLSQLHLSYGRYMVLLAATFAAKTLCAPLLGQFAHRFGIRALLWLGAIAIAPLASGWLLSDSFAYLLILQLCAGGAWAAYELATLLHYFETAKPADRTSILSVFNVGNTAAMLLGSVVGGLLLQQFSASYRAYVIVFTVSTVGRFLALLLLPRIATGAAGRASLPSMISTAQPLAVRPSTGAIEAPDVVSLPLTVRDTLKSEPNVDRNT